MELGVFSVSLAVQDLQASIEFYSKFGFEERGGGDNWRIMTNGSTKLGLFHGMFERNMLTFNPGWNDEAQPLETFDDIRVLRERLRAEGVAMVEDTTQQSKAGPAHLICLDPDGNPVMLDQHV